MKQEKWFITNNYYVAVTSCFNFSFLTCRFQNLGEMMTLGRNDASISPSFIEGLTLEGPIGHAGTIFYKLSLI